MSVREFCTGVQNNRVLSDLKQACYDAGIGVGSAEQASWANSLPRLMGVVQLAELPDSVHIGLEVPVPYCSQRIDAVLYGHDEKGRPSILLVELKQWSEAKSDEDGKINVAMRGGMVTTAHPSAQVDHYRQYLKNFVRACQNEPPVQVSCCVYAHNYPRRDGSLYETQYSNDIARAPIFCMADAEQLADFMRTLVGNDHGAELFDRMDREGLGPSLSLIERASDLIRRQDVFTMLDEQIPAMRSIVRAMSQAARRERKSVILINGGPGTGKSVIALEAFGHALRNKQSTFFATGSSAFTNGIRKILGPDLAPFIRFTDYFWNHAEDSIDVLIVDEAHRLRAKSQPKVPAAQRPTISQLEELVRAAKVTILFMDTNQIIEPDECGDPEQVASLVKLLGVRFSRHELRTQFRCDGSDEYLKWADDLFCLGSGDGQAVLQCPNAFDFDVFDSPHDILAWVRHMNRVEPNSARLTAGWCWPWSDPQPDGELVNDIVIGDFRFPWELKTGKRGKRDIPEAKHWAVVAGGAEQAGTVYSVQGFEFRHVGVIMGPDLVIRDGRWVAKPRANFRNSIRAKPPDVASVFIRRIYRALFTRPLRSARAYSTDAETREFLRSRIMRSYELPNFEDR